MKLEISQNEIMNGDIDWQVRQLKDSTLIKYINFANEIGLKGKKIKEIVVIEPIFTNGIYIDFICEGEHVI